MSKKIHQIKKIQDDTVNANKTQNVRECLCTQDHGNGSIGSPVADSVALRAPKDALQRLEQHTLRTIVIKRNVPMFSSVKMLSVEVSGTCDNVNILFYFHFEVT